MLIIKLQLSVNDKYGGGGLWIIFYLHYGLIVSRQKLFRPSIKTLFQLRFTTSYESSTGT